MSTDPTEAAVAEFYRQAADPQCGVAELDLTYGSEFIAEMMRAAITAYLRAIGPATATAKAVADDALVSALEGTECPEDVVAAVCQALAAEIEAHEED